MSGLVEFLRARLEEDEAAARAADGDRIEATPLYAGVSYPTLRGDRKDRYTGELPATLAGHAARHDPARTLAEAEAKRGILAYAMRRVSCSDAHPQADMYHPDGHADRKLLQLLALPYADHPDYHEEWKP